MYRTFLIGVSEYYNKMSNVLVQWLLSIDKATRIILVFNGKIGVKLLRNLES